MFFKATPPHFFLNKWKILLCFFTLILAFVYCSDDSSMYSTDFYSSPEDSVGADDDTNTRRRRRRRRSRSYDEEEEPEAQSPTCTSNSECNSPRTCRTLFPCARIYDPNNLEKKCRCPIGKKGYDPDPDQDCSNDICPSPMIFSKTASDGEGCCECQQGQILENEQCIPDPVQSVPATSAPAPATPDPVQSVPAPPAPVQSAPLSVPATSAPAPPAPAPPAPAPPAPVQSAPLSAPALNNQPRCPPEDQPWLTQEIRDQCYCPSGGYWICKREGDRCCDVNKCEIYERIDCSRSGCHCIAIPDRPRCPKKSHPWLTQEIRDQCYCPSGRGYWICKGEGDRCCDVTKCRRDENIDCSRSGCHCI